MKKVLMIGNNTGTLEMLEAAKEEGYYTIAAGSEVYTALCKMSGKQDDKIDAYFPAYRMP